MAEPVKRTDVSDNISLQHLSFQTRGMTNSFDKKMGEILSKSMYDLENKFEQLSYHSSKNQNMVNSSKEDVIKNLSDILSPSTKNAPSIEEDLNAVYNYSKKYYSTLKDYETMPSMIPTLVRVMNFLINEVISPDNQSESAFIIKSDSKYEDEIEQIRKTHSLDKELRNIIGNRFRLGKVFYLVMGYTTLFNIVGNLKSQNVLNETSSLSSLGTALSNFKSSIELSESIIINESFSDTKTKKNSLEIDLSKMGISLEFGGLAESYSDMITGISSMLNESVNYSSSVLTGKFSKDDVTVNDFILYETIASSYNYDDGLVLDKLQSESIKSLNEAYGDSYNGTISKDKLVKISKIIANNKSLRRANIQSLDPARVFPLKAANRIIGYFYYEDDSTTVGTFSDYLIKSLKNAKIGKDAYKETEEKVTKKTAEFLLSNIKDNLKIDNVNDIDLLYDYIQNSKLLQGGKKYKFYYKDDIIDISRTDGSILVNSVYQAKLLAFLMHNNIVTKITKGRDREIFTVNMGASASVTPYLQAAMDTLASTNDGVYRALSGPMSKLLNPHLNSTIIIPTQDGTDKFIQADIIQGQDVDMDMDIIKFLQNNIITSYGVDPGIIDLVNNNIDFAKSLTMLNKEMLILNINEQLDIIGGFSKFVLAILYEEGTDSLREAIDSGKIVVELYKPKSLLLELAQNEINSAKSFAEILVELSPTISIISADEDNELTKKIAIYEFVKDYVSANFAKYDNIFEEAATKLYQEYKIRISELKAIRETETTSVDRDSEQDEFVD